ncbi:MAG: diguanylate cyclase [Candidatus Eremiobacteraeota bacterium]|nr:diguanylate cyclase [Candidatus Eremiobacteraeota bacterium]
MGKAPVPENEERRLAALREYALLDTAPDPAYDAFARLAAEICETPMAAVSLVDAGRQWMKATVGFGDLTEVSRDVSFCAHAIVDDGLTEVADATLDPRFADNPVVFGGPELRFYAGVPLVDRGGNALGTLCALDRAPHVLTERQRGALLRLGTSLVSLIETRRGSDAESLANVALPSAALDQSAEPTYILSFPLGGIGTIAYVNAAVCELFEYALPDIVGASPRKLIGPATDLEAYERLRDNFHTSHPIVETISLHTSTGRPVAVEYRDRTIDRTHRIVTMRDLRPFRAAQRVLELANQRLDSVIANNSDPVFTLDASGACVDVNAEAIAHFGHPAAVLLGSSLPICAGGRVFPEPGLPAELARGETMAFDDTYVHRDGRRLDFEIKAIPMIVAGTIEGAYVMARDVTLAKRSARLLEEHAKRTHALYVISAASESAEESQIDAILALVLETLGMSFGYVGTLQGASIHIDHALGDGPMRPGDVFDLAATHVGGVFGDVDVIAFEDLCAPEHRRPGFPEIAWRGYLSARLTIDGRPHGAVGFLSHEVAAFDDFDRDFIRLVASLLSSRLERDMHKERLRKLAYYDALTGLANRAKFLRDLDAAASEARRHGRSFALHFIDLDGFKAVNDHAGHAMGDLALQEAARRLERVARLHDVPARLGGDEFILLQREANDENDTEALGERLVDALCEPYVLDGKTFELSASVGVAVFPDDGRDARELVRNADLALYRAKANGKNRLEFARAS